MTGIGDANILIAFGLADEPHHTQAHQILSAWKNAGEHLAAPRLFSSEITAIVRKMELIEKSEIGLVAAQDVDRFFRDIIQIQTNIFIDACKCHQRQCQHAQNGSPPILTALSRSQGRVTARRRRSTPRSRK